MANVRSSLRTGLLLGAGCLCVGGTGVGEDPRSDTVAAPIDAQSLSATAPDRVAGNARPASAGLGCPLLNPVSANCVPDTPARSSLLDSEPFGGSSPLGITIRDDGAGAATIWAPDLFDGRTFVYDEDLNPSGSFLSPTGTNTTSGIAYDTSRRTLWYIDADLARLVESDLAGVATGNVISCLPRNGDGNTVAGLSYNPDGDGGNGTFIYIDIVGDDVFEITRSSAVVRQIPQSCLDDGSAVFGNGTAYTCGHIEVLAGDATVGDRSVFIDADTGEDLGSTTDLLGATGDTFNNGIVRHPADPDGIMYVVGNATNTIYKVDPVDCPSCRADLDLSGAVDFGDILAILTAWGNAGGPEDLDGSGVVDFGDLLIVLAAWGPCA